MPSRRRRMATLRVLGSQPQHVTDEPNEYGMDASTLPPDVDRDAGRPRSAPSFCQPQAVTPKPFREAVVASETPPAHARGASMATPHETSDAATRRFAFSRNAVYETARPKMPAAAGGIRPSWEDQPLREVAEEATSDDDAPSGPAWAAVARGVALFFGTLIVVDLFSPSSHFTGSLWWLDLRPLPVSAATGFLGVCAAVLVAFAARAAIPKPIKIFATVCVAMLIATALKDATLYYGLLKRGDLHAGPPVAFSLHIVACLGAVLLSLRATPGATGVKDVLYVLMGFNAALISLPIAQIACTGPVDGRRSAAAAIVFSPRAFESEASFEGRAKTAVALHNDGLVPRLVLVGDASDAQFEHLKRIATESDIADAAIERLPSLTEAETFARLKADYPSKHGRDQVLLTVSDVDHLPRLQTAARRAGVKTSPVPATSTHKPTRTVLMREMLELWRQYFRR